MVQSLRFGIVKRYSKILAPLATNFVTLGYFASRISLSAKMRIILHKIVMRIDYVCVSRCPKEHPAHASAPLNVGVIFKAELL